MVSKLHKTEFKPNLTGASLTAFLAVGAKLNSALAVEQGRKLWATFRDNAHHACNGLGIPEAVAALGTFYGECVKAVESNAVAKAIDEAFGTELASTIRSEDGKEGFTKAAEARNQQLWGAKFKLGPKLKAAAATLKQYHDNIKAAVELGVDFHALTTTEIQKANQKARDAADPERLKTAALDDEIRNTGNELAAQYKNAGGPTDTAAKALLSAVAGILANWTHVDMEALAELRSELALIATVAEDAAEAAKREQQAIVGKTREAISEGAKPPLASIEAGEVSSEPKAA